MNNITMDNKEIQIEIKRKIIKSYFIDYKHLATRNIGFRILFKDVKYLKFIGMPKGLYRSYFLEIKDNHLYQKISISAEQKSELKVMLRELK